MKKRVLITGANGFIEDHLIAAAPAPDPEVFSAVRTGNSIQYPEEPDLHYISLGFRDMNLFSKESADQQYDYSISASGIINVKNVSASAKQEEFIFVSSLTATGHLTDAGFSGVTKEQYNVSEKHIYDCYAGSERLKEALHEKTLKFHFPASAVLVIGTNKTNGLKQPKIKHKI